MRVALATAATVLLMIAPAAASTSQGLTRAQRSEGLSVTTGSRVVRAHASSCYSGSVWRKLHNAVGTTLAKYQMDVNWCGNGSTITSRDGVSPFGSVYYLGWSYHGQLSYWNTGGVGWGSWTHFSQGSFTYSIPLVGDTQHWYPWLESHAYAGGKFTYQTG